MVPNTRSSTNMETAQNRYASREGWKHWQRDRRRETEKCWLIESWYLTQSTVRERETDRDSDRNKAWNGDGWVTFQPWRWPGSWGDLDFPQDCWALTPLCWAACWSTLLPFLGSETHNGSIQWNIQHLYGRCLQKGQNKGAQHDRNGTRSDNMWRVSMTGTAPGQTACGRSAWQEQWQKRQHVKGQHDRNSTRTDSM